MSIMGKMMHNMLHEQTLLMIWKINWSMLLTTLTRPQAPKAPKGMAGKSPKGFCKGQMSCWAMSTIPFSYRHGCHKGAAGTAAPCTMWILGRWAGPTTCEVKWNSVCNLYYILLLPISISFSSVKFYVPVSIGKYWVLLYVLACMMVCIDMVCIMACIGMYYFWYELHV